MLKKDNLVNRHIGMQRQMFFIMSILHVWEKQKKITSDVIIRIEDSVSDSYKKWYKGEEKWQYGW